VIIRLWIEFGFEIGLLIRIQKGQEKRRKKSGFKRARKEQKQCSKSWMFSLEGRRLHMDLQ
jgi:hypothetical protein